LLLPDTNQDHGLTRVALFYEDIGQLPAQSLAGRPRLRPSQSFASTEPPISAFSSSHNCTGDTGITVEMACLYTS